MVPKRPPIFPISSNYPQNGPFLLAFYLSPALRTFYTTNQQVNPNFPKMVSNDIGDIAILK